MWHKTIHCWLYDKSGNIYFQIRSDEGTLYTTASGHLLAGESVEDAFSREVREEIGIDIDSSKCTSVGIVKFTLDKLKSDNTMFRDRAFANIYVGLYEGDGTDFKFDESEVLGVVKIKASSVLKLFEGRLSKVSSLFITPSSRGNIDLEKRFISEDLFLLNAGGTLDEKYGDILRKVVEITKWIGLILVFVFVLVCVNL